MELYRRSGDAHAHDEKGRDVLYGCPILETMMSTPMADVSSKKLYLCN
jgi:hypothetical protein